MSGDAVFALLDDASSVDARRCRLYRGHTATLTAHDTKQWDSLLSSMQQALAQGLYAVPLLSYELGAALMDLPHHATRLPLAQVLLFSHCERLTSDEVAQWLASQPGANGDAGIAGIAANISQDAFIEAIGRIRDYIAAGDTYQVNYTYRLRFASWGEPLALYARLRARQPVPYGAFIALPDGGAVLSLSPELFMRHTQGLLQARPMKGTAPASDDANLDAERARELAADTKNRAENLMIVDLLRNDLGRVATTGSVKVPQLFHVQRFGAVLQMTSSIEAQLRADAQLADMFAALYPCGSITGAPKRRTMEIIDELESAPRGLYTGALGWFDPPAPGQAIGDFCLSVPIRTLVLDPPENGLRRGELGVGAGIVYDSDAEAEFAECQLKARFVTGLDPDMALFETLLATREQGCAQRERHLDRLAASCAALGIAFERTAAQQALEQACQQLAPNAPHRMRLAVARDGALSVQTGLLQPLNEPVRIVLAAERTDSSDALLRHKSTRRARYDAAWKNAEAQGAFDALFFNERDELTEGGRSNVFVRLDGKWFTPPLACGLLPGVMRALLLESPDWQAEEKIITRAMLAQAEQIVVCNALRGPLRAQLS